VVEICPIPISALIGSLNYKMALLSISDLFAGRKNTYKYDNTCAIITRSNIQLLYSKYSKCE